MRSRRLKPLQIARYVVQTVFVVYVLVLVIGEPSGRTSNLHTICPFGGLANIYTYLSGDGYVEKLHPAVFVMLLGLVIGLVLTGKSFCGWICPLGSVQEALNAIGRRIWPGLYNRIPRRLEQALLYLKWAVLAWVLVQTARSARLVFQDWDPYYNLFRIWTDEVAMSGYAVTAVTLLLSLFIPRPFCRYACPLGAFNGLFNSFSFVSIKRDGDTCAECGRCTKVCPVNIDICATNTIRSIECTRCLKCVDACPVNSRTGNTLKLHTWFGGPARTRGGATSAAMRRRSVPTWVVGTLAVATFVVPIIVASATGDFQTTGGRGGGGGGGGGGREEIVPGAGNEGAGQEGQGLGEGGSQLIRGSTTLLDVQAMGADISAFLREFGIPEGTPLSTRLSELTEQCGFGMSEVRTYLAAEIP